MAESWTDPMPWVDQYGGRHSDDSHGKNGTTMWRCYRIARTRDQFDADEALHAEHARIGESYASCRACADRTKPAADRLRAGSGMEPE